MYQKDPWDNEMLQPTSAAMLDFLPPAAYPHLPATSFATKFVHVSTNKIRTAVNAVLFMPDGRRLLTCSQNGEFTMWNGMSFNFETILQAHNCAIRAAAFSHNENWLISGDDAGTLKYWQTNLNNLKSISGAHSEPVRGVARFHRPQVLLVLGRHDGQGVGFRARADDLRAHGSRRRRQVGGLASATGAARVRGQRFAGEAVGRQERFGRGDDSRAQEPGGMREVEPERELAGQRVSGIAGEGV